MTSTNRISYTFVLFLANIIILWALLLLLRLLPPLGCSVLIHYAKLFSVKSALDAAILLCNLWPCSQYWKVETQPNIFMCFLRFNSNKQRIACIVFDEKMSKFVFCSVGFIVHWFRWIAKNEREKPKCVCAVEWTSSTLTYSIWKAIFCMSFVRFIRKSLTQFHLISWAIIVNENENWFDSLRPEPFFSLLLCQFQGNQPSRGECVTESKRFSTRSLNGINFIVYFSGKRFLIKTFSPRSAVRRTPN